MKLIMRDGLHWLALSLSNKMITIIILKDMEELIKNLEKFYENAKIHFLHDRFEEMELNLNNIIDACQTIIKKCDKLKEMANI